MRLALFLAACILGLLGAAGFYLALAPDEYQTTPVFQEDYGVVFPEPQDIKRIYPTPEPTPAPTPAPTPEPTPAPTPPPTPAPATPAPAPVMTPAPAPPQEIAAETMGLEREALAALVHATFPDNPRMGNHVVWHETLMYADWWGYVYGGVMSATNDCGLMQTSWTYHAERYAARGWGLADCFIPKRNLVIAREIYEDQGPRAWTTY